MTIASGMPETLLVNAVRFTPERVLAYGRITNDLNPLHIDAEFAASSRFGKPIVHGLFVLAPVWNALDRQFGTKAITGAQAKLRFVAPTFIDTIPAYGVEFSHGDEDGAHYSVRIADADGKLAVEGSICIPTNAA